MALTVTMMRAIVRQNGHLMLEGGETKDELKEALLNLRQHTYDKCKKPYLGTPIDSLIPSIDVLMVSPSKRRQSVQSVVTSKERL